MALEAKSITPPLAGSPSEPWRKGQASLLSSPPPPPNFVQQGGIPLPQAFGGMHLRPPPGRGCTSLSLVQAEVATAQFMLNSLGPAGMRERLF